MSAITASSEAPRPAARSSSSTSAGEHPPIHHVREVIRYTSPRRVSGDPRVLGVISLRAERIFDGVEIETSPGE